MPSKFLSTLPARGATLWHQAADCPQRDFYPRSPRGERLPYEVRVLLGEKFLSTLPARGATTRKHTVLHPPVISIHAPREGSDRNSATFFQGIEYFYPRSPRGERLCHPRRMQSAPAFLSTLPARGATRGWASSPPTARYFYPRSPRGERPVLPVSALWPAIFLSTLPARGATHPRGTAIRASAFLSTLPARGATVGRKVKLAVCDISIHAPREGSDSRAANITSNSALISIHAPREGSDPCGWSQTRDFQISIHAPREGSDFYCTCGAAIQIYFYPRSPRGERLSRPAWRPGRGYFYPRSPRGERPDLPDFATVPQLISIHAPREGSDPAYLSITGRQRRHFYPRSPRGERPGNCCHVGCQSDFYPRSPRGERLCRVPGHADLKLISIHAPREGSDKALHQVDADLLISIHAPREGSDVAEGDEIPFTKIFLSTLPARGAT